MFIKLTKAFFLSTLFFLTLLFCVTTYAHSTNPRGLKPLKWHTEQIADVAAFLPFAQPGYVSTKNIKGRSCMAGPMLSVNVSDLYAYDIDETVTIEIEFDMEETGRDIKLQYDKNGGVVGTQNIKLKKREDHRFYRHTFTLERARFVGRKINQFSKGDFSISGLGHSGEGAKNITVCDITIKRSYETQKPFEYGGLSLSLFDESGHAIPARVGIYDKTGRMPMPREGAIPVSYFSEATRSIPLPANNGVYWPSNNPQAFYIDGHYQAKLPVGSYYLIVARGLEYRVLEKKFVINADKDTSLEVQLIRWTDMPTKGWYSGDVHVHSRRRTSEDSSILRLQAKAEDLNVVNVLQMGNISGIYYQQSGWGEAGRYGEYPYTLVSGQEDPRTRRLGHTIQLNIEKPVRFPKRYYLYNDVFEEIRKQGGLTGYAHSALSHIPPYRECPGLALDLPYHLVDFIELNAGASNLSCWFDALNLGYKLSLAAGTDFPYAGIPGAVRTYVQTGNPYTAQAWFDGLKAGRTFVTNGPMLELRINGKGMGSDLRVNKDDKLTIHAMASINPDTYPLEKIELIQQGEVIATEVNKKGGSELHLHYETKVNHGAWFVIRAQGKDKNIVAVSSPIYVYAADTGFCKPSAIPTLAAKFKDQMKEALEMKLKDIKEYEAWDTFSPRLKYWPKNKSALQQRIIDASQRYDRLVTLSASQDCVTD